MFPLKLLDKYVDFYYNLLYYLIIILTIYHIIDVLRMVGDIDVL